MPRGSGITIKAVDVAPARLRQLWEQRCGKLARLGAFAAGPGYGSLREHQLYRGRCSKGSGPKPMVILRATGIWAVRGAGPKRLPGGARELLWRGLGSQHVAKELLSCAQDGGVAPFGGRALWGSGMYFTREICKAAQFCRQDSCRRFREKCSLSKGFCLCPVQRGALLACTVVVGKQHVPCDKLTPGQIRCSTSLSKTTVPPAGSDSILAKGFHDPEHSEIVVGSTDFRVRVDYVVTVALGKASRLQRASW
jgi:hypothetical protein